MPDASTTAAGTTVTKSQLPFAEYLSREMFGNTIQDYLIAAAVFVSVMFGLYILKAVVLNRLRAYAKNRAPKLEPFLTGLMGYFGPLVFLFAALYLSTRSLILPGSVEQILQIVFVAILTVKVVQLLESAAAFSLQTWALRTQEEDPTMAVAFKNIALIVRVVLWAAGILFVLDNLGINVTALVAGLGIGGVAVALAAQALLGDAFSSFAIFMDKPFKVGDFIIVDDLLGTVENVGFKTTRIRSLHGEQLIFANSDLTKSRIRNYKRMETRRIAFEIGVIYQTTAAQVKAIPDIVKKIVAGNKKAKLDRVHFKSFGDFALIFEIVYYVLSPDYNIYMDVQQFINVGLKDAFEAQGIDFAYPTQQLYLTTVQPGGK